MVTGRRGKIWDELKYFEEDFGIYDVEDAEGAEDVGGNKVVSRERVELIHDALVMGIGDYFRKLRFSKAILGLSGGIDSAVTLVLAAGPWAKTMSGPS